MPYGFIHEEYPQKVPFLTPSPRRPHIRPDPLPFQTSEDTCIKAMTYGPTLTSGILTADIEGLQCQPVCHGL